MAAANVPIVASRNADLVQSWTFRDRVTQTPVDLTGYSFHAMVRLYPGAAGAALIDIPLTATTGVPAIQVPTPTNGVVTLYVPKASLLALAVADALNPATPLVLAWDMTWTTPSGETDLVAQGAFTVNTGVVR